METKIIELTSQIEMIKELRRTEYVRLNNKLIEILNNTIVTANDAMILSTNLNIFEHETYIIFELGFYNKETCKVDFGSSVSFRYSTNEELCVNYGTIGSFTKENTYQVRRAKLIVDVFDKIDVLEHALELLVAECDGKYLEYSDEKYRYETELKAVKDQLKEEQKKKIEDTISINDTLVYDKRTLSSKRLFPTVYSSSWKIVKITPKTVRIETSSGMFKQLSKDELINHISDGLILVNKELTND